MRRAAIRLHTKFETVAHAENESSACRKFFDDDITGENSPARRLVNNRRRKSAGNQNRVIAVKIVSCARQNQPVTDVLETT